MEQTCGWCGGPSAAGTCDDCLAAAPDGLPPEPRLEPGPPPPPPGWVPALTADDAAPPAVGPASGAVPPGWYPVDGQVQWWDGAAWGPPPVTATFKPFRPVDGLAVAVQVLAGVGMAISVATIVVATQRVALIDRFLANPIQVSDDELQRSDDLYALVILAGLLVFAATIVLFLVWLHRVFRNLEGALRSPGVDHSPGWAVGWWFVPLANLVKPKHVMNEAWMASRPDHRPGDVGWRHHHAPALLSWWWGIYLLSGFVTRFASGDDEDLQALRDTASFDRVGEVLTLVAAVLFVLVVRGITRLQGERAARLAAAG